MPLGLGALLGAAALGSGVSGLFGLAGSGANYAQSVKLQKMQNDFNLDMWNKNNEYNSPQAQMQRFKLAGLNPNLIYSQGSSGLSSSPPVQNAPQGVDWSRPMSELGKAFNIENLKTLIANRKKAEADASNASTNAKRNDLEFQAEHLTGLNYSFNYNTGKWELRPQLEPNQVRVVHPASFYVNRIFENNYNKSSLIPYRSALYDWQKRYLVPQVQMLNYERGKQPVTYWINTVGKGVRTAADAVGIFSPKNWFVPRTSFNPYTNNY